MKFTKKLCGLGITTLFCLSLFAVPEKSAENPPPASMTRKILHKTALFSAGATFAASLGVCALGSMQILGGLENNLGASLLGIGILALGFDMASRLPEAILEIDKKYISGHESTVSSGLGFFAAGFLTPVIAIAYLKRLN